MGRLVIDQARVDSAAVEALRAVCPFDAFIYEDGELSVGAACRMCRICVKSGPEGVVRYEEDEQPPEIDRDSWRGVAVYAEQAQGRIAPVVFELLGKARELAAVTGHPVYALLIGENMEDAARRLLEYGADKVFVYDDGAFADFRVAPYANAFEDFVLQARPSSVLVGATNLGRSLAPRVAARLGTGLTADCTRLEMKENTDLVQIRPAFGGNIMAQIVTPRHRPQFCTVRYKIFSAPPKGEPRGEIVRMRLPAEKLCSAARVVETQRKSSESDISEADAIVAVGRGVRSQKEFALAGELAEALGAQLACTRPLIENGWFGPKKQIGLSGRTVKPGIIVTLGVSGSVQFAAGMQNAECIIAVDNDESAPIFGIAHYGVVGDVSEVVPRLLEAIRQGREVREHA